MLLNHKHYLIVFIISFLLLIFSCFVSNIAHAGFWSDRSEFVDTWWGSTQLHWNFKYASRIDLVLWNDEQDRLVGLAAFGKGNRCVGYVSLQAGTDHLQFKSIEGDACAGLDEGYFQPVQKRNNRIILTWYPTGTQAQDKPKLGIVNTAFYGKSKNKNAPEYLQSFIAKFKSNKEPIDELIAKYSDEHDRVIASAKARLEKKHDVKSSEANLIGVWKGEFIDRYNVYPVEIAFWPSKVHQLQRIVGVFSFDGRQCSTGFVILNVDPEITLSSNHKYIGVPSSNCIRTVGGGHIQITQSRDELAIFFKSRYNNLSGLKPKQHCLDDLPREGCFSLGVFKRTKASSDLVKLVDSVKWNVIDPPEKRTWEYLKKEGRVPTSIEVAYREAADKNTEVRARLIAEAEKANVERRKKEQKSYERRLAARKIDKGLKSEKSGISDLEISREILEGISGPFSVFDGGGYLNAIYQGDLSLVRHADRVYLADLQPLIQETANMVKTMAPLVELLSGGVLDQKYVHHTVDKGFKNASIFKRVLATYLFNYQRYSSRCLRSDHVKFTVYSSSPDIVYTNYLGVEVARIYGDSSQDTYFVNKEFQSVFRDIGNSQSKSAGGTLVDTFYNKGKITELFSGTKNMMAKYPCDSPEIKRLEESFLTLYSGL